MTEAAIKSFLEDLYRSRLTNDVSRFLPHFAPNAIWHFAGSVPEAGPVSAVSNDTDSLEKLVAVLVATWKWHSHEIKSITVQENRAAVHFRLTTEFTPTRKVIDTELLDLFTISNGKVSSLVEFVDTALVAKLAAGAK